MAAADQTPTTAFKLQHITPFTVRVAKATQNDWITVPNNTGGYCWGVWAVQGTTTSISANAAETFTFQTLAINNAGTAYGTNDTTIAYNNAIATRYPPYYIKSQSGELILVTADSGAASTSGNLTVRRGCLGTIASVTGLANTNVLTVMNQVILGSATVGPTDLLVFPMPEDYRENLYKAAPR